MIGKCPVDLLESITEECAKYDVDVNLALSISWQESKWNTSAMRFEKSWYKNRASGMGCSQLKEYNKYTGSSCSYETERMAISTSWGPFQMMGIVLRESGFDEAFFTSILKEDGRLASEYAIKHIKKLLKNQNGDIEKAISDYNDGNPNKMDNVKYVREVMNTYNQLKEERK